MTWPAQPLDVNIIENLRRTVRTIKLKLQSETDMDKTRAVYERSLHVMGVAVY